jgi:hypothetical protein
MGEEIERQYKEDNCICASCWLGFLTLKRSALKEGVDKEGRQMLAKSEKIGKQYWKELRGANAKANAKYKKWRTKNYGENTGSTNG